MPVAENSINVRNTLYIKRVKYFY